MSGLTRAAELFEAWRQRVEGGPAEPFDELVRAHPELRSELESLRRVELALDDFQPQLPPSLIQGTPSGSRPRRRGGLAPGDELGDFRIVRKLGQGGMGIVFEAEQISLHRRVALKILPAQLTLNPQALERFQREAEITGRLKHRGIVSIYQVGEQDGIHFIVMELVEGASLDRVIDRMRGESFDSVRKLRVADMIPADGPDEAPITRPRTPVPSGTEHGSGKRKASSSASNKNYIESAVQLICQVADALQHAHLATVVHRDIKPSNILVRRDGTPVLTDFGLARETGLPGITVTGEFAGTANYVSPEQAMSGRVPVDWRSDIFSLGATLYELVTLHVAFEGDSLPDILGRIQTKPPIPPQRLNAALAPGLVTILEKSLEKDPDRRYQTAAEFAADLRAFIEGRPLIALRTGTVVRTLRWAKREPLKAALGTVFVLGVPGATVLWTRAVEARKDADESRSRLELAKLPDKLEDGFLDLGTGELARAESTFAEVLARNTDSPEAAAGLAMARLGQGRAAEALGGIEQFEAGHERALGRLRVEALHVLGQKAAALELERTLAPPRTASDKYLEAVRRLYGRPFLSGLPAGSLLSLVRARPSAAVRLDDRKDSLVAYRERAREAIELLEDAAADENRAIYHFALAWAAWVARDREVAERYGESIARKWPESRIGRFYAALAREVGDPAGALEEYARLLEQDPGLWMARQRRAELFVGQGRSDLAVREAQELVESDPERLSFQIGLAHLLLLDGQLEAAERVARGALEQDRSAAQAHDILGLVLYARGDAKSARDSFELAAGMEPARALYQVHLGWTRFELGEKERARECLERARKLDPADPMAAFHLGLVKSDAEEHEAALKDLDEALELLDANPSSGLPRDLVLGARGLALHRLGRNQEAIESLRGALELAPEDATHLFNLGEVAAAAGRLDESIEARERWLQLETGTEDLHHWLCSELQKRREFERALAAAKRWTAVFAADSMAWNERAWIQVDPGVVPPIGDPDDALRSARRAVELSHGENFSYVDTLACAQFASGMQDEALENARDALRLARGDGADPGVLGEIEAHLRLFEAGR